MSEENLIDFKSVYELGKNEVKIFDVDGVDVVIHPNDMSVKDFKSLQDSLLPAPRFFEQKCSFDTIESFIEYFTRYKSEQSSIFYNEDGQFTGYLDWHPSAEVPSFKRHVITYNAKKTADLKKWIENNNKQMDQEDFSYFIEDTLKDFDEPGGAKMHEIASTLKATIGAEFEQSIKVENGQYRMAWKETIEGRAGVNGAIPVPNEFTIIISAFGPDKLYKLGAWLRYRPSKSGVRMWYTLKNPQIVIDTAIADNLAAVKDKLPGTPIYCGRA